MSKYHRGTKRYNKIPDIEGKGKQRILSDKKCIAKSAGVKDLQTQMLGLQKTELERSISRNLNPALKNRNGGLCLFFGNGRVQIPQFEFELSDLFAVHICSGNAHFPSGC